MDKQKHNRPKAGLPPASASGICTLLCHCEHSLECVAINDSWLPYTVDCRACFAGSQ
ncbi:MAG: hypothetical protein K2F85_00215 [Helicobacter sp.]|nr:hypothetical protein [Helicobacter sp.]